MVKVKTLTDLRNSLWRDPGFIWQTYLVWEEESDRLFMVRYYYNGDDKEMGYNVYSITSDDSDVRLCKSLGGLVMFIWKNHCFAVKASKYPEFKANTIYFCGNWPKKNQQADTFYYDHTKENKLLSDKKKNTKKRPGENNTSVQNITNQVRVAGHGNQAVKMVLLDGQNIEKVGTGKGSLFTRRKTGHNDPQLLGEMAQLSTNIPKSSYKQLPIIFRNTYTV
ncbi:TSL-kinase interacting protein [Orobanche hederae]